MVRQTVPDRRQSGDRSRVINPVSLRGVLVNSMGKRLRHDCSEIVAEGCPSGSRLTEKCKVRLPVIADGKLVSYRRPLQKSIAFSDVILHSTAAEKMIRIHMPTDLETEAGLGRI